MTNELFDKLVKYTVTTLKSYILPKKQFKLLYIILCKTNGFNTFIMKTSYKYTAAFFSLLLQKLCAYDVRFCLANAYDMYRLF